MFGPEMRSRDTRIMPVCPKCCFFPFLYAGYAVDSIGRISRFKCSQCGIKLDVLDYTSAMLPDGRMSAEAHIEFPQVTIYKKARVMWGLGLLDVSTIIPEE